MALLRATKPPAASPCSRRAMTSISIDWLAPASIDAAMKPKTANVNALPRPKRSPSLPHIITATVCPSRYEVKTQAADERSPKSVEMSLTAVAIMSRSSAASEMPSIRPAVTSRLCVEERLCGAS